MPTCVIVKHTNPCGVASRDDLLEAYRLAVIADPISAFGGIVAFNRCAAACCVGGRLPRGGQGALCSRKAVCKTCLRVSCRRLGPALWPLPRLPHLHQPSVLPVPRGALQAGGC